MIDKEKPGVVPAIVFIRVFDALVAYSNLGIVPWHLNNTSMDDLKDLTVQTGIHTVNVGAKNCPLNTYGIAIVIANVKNLWRYVFFIPTNVTNAYLIFYNGYGDGWTDWVGLRS